MKSSKHIYLCLMTIFVLLIQLMSPALVHADDETPPAPTEAPIGTSASELTEAPTEIPATEPPTADPSLSTPEPTKLSTGAPTDSVAPTVEPIETATPAPTETSVTEEAATPPPTEAATESPTESPTPDPSLATPVSPDLTERSSDAPTAEPVETSIATPEPTDAATSVVTEAPTLLEAQQAIPESTNIVVLDENGQPLPLATQQTAEIVANSDPVWCPAGQAPTPGANGCSVSFATLTDLVNGIGVTINQSGTIWITSGLSPEPGPVAIDGAIYSMWANNALTMQGGWSGINGDSTIGSSSVFSVPISITNWGGDVTLNNLTLNGTPLTAGTGLHVETKGTIHGKDIVVTNHFSGADLYGVNGVTITGTNTFSDNYVSGLSVVSLQGAVTLNNLTTSNINGNGAYIFGATGITLTGTNIFNNDAYGGIWAQSPGAISINNLTVSNTGDGIGAYLSSGGDLTMTGTNVFTGNISGGLSASFGGNATLNNVTADFNGKGNGSGNAWIAVPGSGVSLTSSGGNGDVIFTGINYFRGNGSAELIVVTNGLTVVSSGNIILNNIVAEGNAQKGVSLDNTGGTGNVTLTNGTFNDNQCQCEGSGASVFSSGNVSINQSLFNRNGLYINTTRDVITNDVTVNGAQGVGLGVETKGGNVTLNNSHFINSIPNYNLQIFPYGDGVDLFPNGGNVTVTNSEFSGNEWGLWVVDGNQVSILDTIFDKSIPPMNQVDLAVWCALNSLGLSFPESIPISLNVNPDCTYSTPVSSSSTPVKVENQTSTVISQMTARSRPVFPTSRSHNPMYHGKAEFWLNCGEQNNFKVNLPNGDRVDIYCPVSGKATITRLDNTTLPAELPTGYTFASAFDVEVLQPSIPLTRDPESQDYLRTPISVIKEGGHIMASFVAPPLQSGKTFSILYWDNDHSQWIPLKDFLFGRAFKLFPDLPQDERKILSGVLPDSKIAPDRVQVSTNFPGIFVLAQH